MTDSDTDTTTAEPSAEPVRTYGGDAAGLREAAAALRERRETEAQSAISPEQIERADREHHRRVSERVGRPVDDLNKIDLNLTGSKPEDRQTARATALAWSDQTYAQGGSRPVDGEDIRGPCRRLGRAHAETHAVDLAAYTGLRLSDLMRLSWSHVREEEGAIILATGKSRGKREAIIPLYDGLRAVLARIPKRATTILTSSKRRPWTVDGFGSSFNKAKIDAKMADRDLHFHDLRGTAVTRFYISGIPERVIAEIVGWSEEQVSKIIRRYVGRAAATRALIRTMNKKRV